KPGNSTKPKDPKQIDLADTSKQRKLARMDKQEKRRLGAIPVAPIRPMTPPINDAMHLAKEQSFIKSENLPRGLNEVDSSGKNENPAVLFYGPGQLKLVGFPVPRLADENGKL
ncbi:hypothetical protein Bhyg_13561, partial [Pseudolycoriella hygida]